MENLEFLKDFIDEEPFVIIKDLEHFKQVIELLDNL